MSPAAMSLRPASSGRRGPSLLGWGIVPLEYGMAAALTWPLLALGYDDADAYGGCRNG